MVFEGLTFLVLIPNSFRLAGFSLEVRETDYATVVTNPMNVCSEWTELFKLDNAVALGSAVGFGDPAFHFVSNIRPSSSSGFEVVFL